jgi:hypothetical protein
VAALPTHRLTHRLARGLTGRTALTPGQEVSEPSMVTEPNGRRRGVGKRQPPARGAGRSTRAARTVSPAVVGVPVVVRRKLGPVAQSGQDQRRRADQSQEMHPRDHEHQLDVG